MEPLKPLLIALEGNIGAGKTTLALRLAEKLGAAFVPERFENNPLLPLFYADPQRHAFALEVSFLEDRYRQLRDEIPAAPLLVSDYYFGKSLVFARINLQNEELKLFERLYARFAGEVAAPALLVYLHRGISGLQRNISRRGREYEQQIQDEYLQKIEAGYHAHFNAGAAFPVLHLDTEELDNEALLARIMDELRKRFSINA